MNIKRIFGAALTILGIGGLLFASVIFVGNAGSSVSVKTLIVYLILGLLFFVSGINLIRATKDGA